MLMALEEKGQTSWTLDGPLTPPVCETDEQHLKATGLMVHGQADRPYLGCKDQ